MLLLPLAVAVADVIVPDLFNHLFQYMINDDGVCISWMKSPLRQMVVTTTTATTATTATTITITISIPDTSRTERRCDYRLFSLYKKINVVVVLSMIDDEGGVAVLH